MAQVREIPYTVPTIQASKITYYRLVNHIRKSTNGITTPKRHGAYVALNVYDDYALQLDTWSNQICLFKNKNFIKQLGMDFGGFKCDIALVKYWLAHLRLLNR